MHDVNDEITVVEQHPLRLLDALPGPRLTASILEEQLLLNLLGNGQNLTFVRSGGDHHEVADAEFVAHVVGHHVLRLHAIGRSRGDAHRIDGLFQSIHFNAPKLVSSCLQHVACSRSTPSRRPGHHVG